MVGLVKAKLPGHLVDDKPLDGRSHENKMAVFLAAAARNAPGIIQGHGVRDYISVAGRRAAWSVFTGVSQHCENATDTASDTK